MKTYLIDAIRTPVGKFRGSLSPVRADDLAAIPIAELLKRNPSIPQEAYADVILGCANQAGEDNRNVARMALLLAGLPFTVPGETINRLCSSGFSSAIQAHRAIQTGDGDIFITGGMEHMTRGPYAISKPHVAYGNDSKMYDTSFGWRFVNPKMEKLYGTHAMGETAENLAEKFNISREDQDKFAAWSQEKAARAQESGRLAQEIVPVSIPQRKKDDLVFDQDEFLRPSTTTDILSTLRPAFKKKGGTVTAGNASGLNDGAAAMIIASEKAVAEYGLDPMAEIISSAVVGVEPKIMGIGPVYAVRKALEKANLELKDMDVIEINEAFSAQVLACTRELGLEDNDPRINPNGGAIAIGHPLGMTGARLLQSAAIELINKNKKYALITMCVGVGQGYAGIIKNAKFD